MKKSRNPNKFQTRSYAPYDPKMIGDFIEHLKWGLELSMAEHRLKLASEAGRYSRPVDTELLNQLGKYAEKRGCRRLIVEPVIDSKEAGALYFEDRKLYAELAWEADMDLRMLDALETRLQQALACASRAGQEVYRKVSLQRELEMNGHDHSGDYVTE